jgi:hypothetical protein
LLESLLPNQHLTTSGTHKPNLKTDAYLGELGFLEPVDSLFLPLEVENHSPMTTQLSEICDVGQLIYTMHPTAA